MYEEPLRTAKYIVGTFFLAIALTTNVSSGQSPFTERLSEKQRMAEVTPKGWPIVMSV